MQSTLTENNTLSQPLFFFFSFLYQRDLYFFYLSYNLTNTVKKYIFFESV